MAIMTPDNNQVIYAKDCLPCIANARALLDGMSMQFIRNEHEGPRRIIPMDGQTLLSGTKKDEGKARWDLLPLEVVDAVARILTRGAQKYAARNWEKGIAYGRVFAGVMRHLTEWWICKLFGRDGINHTDGPESHIDHAITGLMFLSAYEKRNMTAFDDRPGTETK